jgi:hypothetical protein
MSITEKRILRKAARLIDLQRTDIHGAILKQCEINILQSKIVLVLLLPPIQGKIL